MKFSEALKEYIDTAIDQANGGFRHIKILERQKRLLEIMDKEIAKLPAKEAIVKIISR